MDDLTKNIKTYGSLDGYPNGESHFEGDIETPEYCFQFKRWEGEQGNGAIMLPTALQDWAREHCGDWRYIFQPFYIWGIGFYNEFDAIAFKIAWAEFILN